MTRREGHGVVVGPGEGETITRREHRDLVIVAERDDITITRMRYGPSARVLNAHAPGGGFADFLRRSSD
jgi:hypothetical protein